LRLDDGLGEGPWLISRSPVTAIDGLAAHHLQDPALAPFRAQLIGWLDAHGAEAVLVRPDRYVFGTGEPAALAVAWAAALKPKRQSVLTAAEA
jgi:3-(3-hydroxy-phenyl)propionate hydroxylase